MGRPRDLLKGDASAADHQPDMMAGEEGESKGGDGNDWRAQCREILRGAIVNETDKHELQDMAQMLSQVNSRSADFARDLRAGAVSRVATDKPLRRKGAAEKDGKGAAKKGSRRGQTRLGRMMKNWPV